MNEKKGSSLIAIKKWIQTAFELDVEPLMPYVKVPMLQNFLSLNY